MKRILKRSTAALLVITAMMLASPAWAQVNLLPLVRQVGAEHPELLRTNTNASCYQFARLVLERIKAEGYTGWSFVGKTAGEGQYTPPGWVPRQVGPHRITGVSHDAITSDTQRIDLLGNGNDGPDPLGSPAIPQWLEIPREHWRPNNPPVPLEWAAGPAPIPVKPPYPGDAYFVERVGAVLAADYAEAGQTLNAGSVVWISRTIWRHVNEGMTIDQSTAQSRKEWRAALGLPPLP